MATQPEEILDDEIDTEVEPVDDEPEVEDDPSTDDDTSTDEEGEEEDEISFGGTAVDAGEAESEGVRNLREALKREKEARKAAEAKLAPAPVDIGAEPDIDDYWDHDNPKEAWKRDFTAWTARKVEQDQRIHRQRQDKEAAQREYQQVERSFEEQGAALRVRDYPVARDSVMERFDVEQRAMFLQATEKPAALVYLLSKQSDKLDAILKIENPIRFTAAIARLDAETKVTPRKPSTQPETVHRGAGGAGGDADAKKLAALEAEADRTGNRTKVIEFNRRMREKNK